MRRQIKNSNKLYIRFLYLIAITIVVASLSMAKYQGVYNSSRNGTNCKMEHKS